MFALNDKSQEIIKKIIGLSYDEITTMDAEDIDKLIEQKIGKTLELKSSNDQRLEGRGSVYMALKRFLSLKSTDEYLSKI